MRGGDFSKVLAFFYIFIAACLFVYVHTQIRFIHDCEQPNRLYKSVNVTQSTAEISFADEQKEEPHLQKSKVQSFSMPFTNQAFNASYLITPKLSDCHDTLMLAVILSSPSNFEIRRTIRATWASKTQPLLQSGQIQPIFIVGLGSLQENQLLREEALDFKDILQISVEDTYRNLVLKTLSLLHFHKHFCKARFLLKVDDDVVFLFPRFMHFLNDDRVAEFEPVIYGKLWTRSKPQRNSTHRWYISMETFDGKVLPRFCSGPSYILNELAVDALLEGTENIQLIYNVEDVFVTGLLAEKVGVKRMAMNRSIYPRNVSGVLSPLGVACDSHGEPYVFSIHGWKTPTQIHNVWVRLKSLRCRKPRPKNPNKKSEKQEPVSNKKNRKKSSIQLIEARRVVAFDEALGKEIQKLSQIY